MGTDIHAVSQAKIDGKWVDIDSDFDNGRHYKLFAHLAGVRNGRGFAGVNTGDEVSPIQEYRGFPADFMVYDEYHNDTWMGDHSYGWVSAREVINHDWGQGYSCGVISIDQYKEWDGGYPAGGWCSAISGRNIVVAERTDEITDLTTHVRVWWRNKPSEFDYFIDEVNRMVSKYGDEVRIVFGFDS